MSIRRWIKGSLIVMRLEKKLSLIVYCTFVCYNMPSLYRLVIILFGKSNYLILNKFCIDL